MSRLIAATVQEILIYLLIGLHANLRQLVAAVLFFLIHWWFRRIGVAKALSYASALFAGAAVAHFLWEAQKPDYPMGLALLPTLTVTVVALLLAGAASAKTLSRDWPLLTTLLSGAGFVTVAMVSDFDQRVWPILVGSTGWLFVALSLVLNLRSAIGGIHWR